MSRDRRTSPPEWMLERARRDDLTPAQQVELDAVDPTVVAARMAELDASDEDILRRHPPRVVRAAIDERARASAIGVRWQWAVPAAIAVATVVLVLTREPVPLGSSSTEGGASQLQEASDRVKGLRPQLLVFRKTGADPVPLHDGDSAAPGDELQVGFVRGAAAHGAIVSVDGNGALTVHAADLAAAPESGATFLDHAFELDRAPGFERFILLTSDAPIDLGGVETAIRRMPPGSAATSPLPLPAEIAQTSLLVRKESP